MTDSMIARVARAIRDLPWDGNEPLNAHDDADAIARAAIQAMREPTKETVRQAVNDGDAILQRMAAKWLWQDMIDAALAEEKR